MADTLYLVLKKVALSLGEAALEKLSTEIVEVASVQTDFEHGMKRIESEFMILQAFIGQVNAHNVGDKTFEAWLDQVINVAHQVEDIIDEHSFLASQAAVINNFFKRKFHQVKSFAAWQSLSHQIDEVETRIQQLSTMKDRYAISIGELGRSNTLQYARQLSLSDSAYLSDDTELVGNASEIGRLKQWLLSERQDRSIMSILGMGGIGKTTIASSVYKNQRISRVFDCYAWVTLSQDCQVEDLVKQIMKQLIDQRAHMAGGIETMSRVRLIEELQRNLWDKKYLIVLDDVWDTKNWLFINSALVQNNCGSRVIVTTRKKDVASVANDGFVVELKILPYIDAWHLFCQKAFRRLQDKICPANLRPWAEKIVKKCQGLPLALIAIGSLLSYRELEEQEWSSLLNQLSWQLVNSPELSWIMSVLNLSFIDLPGYLKNCFLYCSLFPEDYKIRRRWICRLWVTEGLVEERGAGTTMEEVAECYLNELTRRSLLEVAERNVHGRARSFQMHDLVRDACLTIANREKFSVAYSASSKNQVTSEARRLFVQKDARSLKVASASQIRSFILFDTQVASSWINDISSNFRLIRVLCLRFANIHQVPGVVSDLLNLHYLDLAHTKVKHIPASFGKLRNLQVLDLRFSYVEQLPWEITLLTKLRHLYVYMLHDVQGRIFDCFSATNMPANVCCLKNLQTLQSVSANKDLITQLGNLTLMRSLAIMKMHQNYIAELWGSLAKMPSLSRLVVFANKDEVLNLVMLKPLPNLKFFWLRGRLYDGLLPQMFASFERLSTLKLDCCCLKKDPISSFAYMLSLVDLRLYRTYDGEQLTFRAGWFPKLSSLELGGMEHLNSIEMEEGTMKVLHTLEMIGLRGLKVVPRGIKYIDTLQKMLLADMPKEFMGRLQGDDHDIVEHIPNIQSFDSSNSQAGNLHAYNVSIHWANHLVRFFPKTINIRKSQVKRAYYSACCKTFFLGEHAAVT
jgi:disease resistance protein RPM1